MRRILTIALALMLVSAAALTWATPAAQDQERETFRALARHTGTGPNGQTTITINIDRWSTDAEREALLEVVMNENNQAIADALGKMDSVGFLRTTGRSANRGTGSWQLRYASQTVAENGVRTIRLASDRPIHFVEAVRQSPRSWDSQTTLIELNVDENGEGEGVLMAGVEFTVDAKNNTLTLSHLSSNPVRLEQVRH